MAKIFTDENTHNRLADSVIEGANIAYQHFFKEAEKIINLKRVSVVELNMFCVFQGWAILRSHLLQKGMDQDDQMILLGTIMHKFSSGIADKLQKRGMEWDADYWNNELKERVLYYQKIVNDDGNRAEKLMDAGFKKIKKPGISNLFSSRSLKSEFGKLFMSAAYMTTVCVEERLKQIIK